MYSNNLPFTIVVYGECSLPHTTKTIIINRIILQVAKSHKPIKSQNKGTTKKQCRRSRNTNRLPAEVESYIN